MVSNVKETVKDDPKLQEEEVEIEEKIEKPLISLKPPKDTKVVVKNGSISRLMMNEIGANFRIKGLRGGRADLIQYLAMAKKMLKRWNILSVSYRTQLVGGNHVLSYRNQWNDEAEWTDVANDLPYFRVILDGANKAGPPVNLEGLFVTGMSVVNGSDPGSVSTVLRTRLTQLNAEVNLNVAMQSGESIIANIGTSTCPTLLKLMLMLDNCSLIDLGGEDVITNTKWISEDPIEQESGNSDLWPFGSEQIAAVYGPGTMTAMAVSVGDYYRILNDELVTIAGWEPKWWGDFSTNGVVIVPIRSSWNSDYRTNWAWTKGRCEYPMHDRQFEGTLIDIGQNVLIADTPGYTPSGRVAIAGGRRKILYVVIDKFNDVVGQIDIGLPGAIVAVQPAHYVVGGVALDMTAVPTAELAFGADTQHIWNAILRWKRLWGNQDDWDNAMLLASEFYNYYKISARKIDDTIEGAYWNEKNGDPFTMVGPWLGTYENPVLIGTVAQFKRQLTTATGNLGMTTIGKVRAGGSTWTLRNEDPIISIALAARLIRYATPLTKDIATSPGNLASRHSIKSIQIALGTDLLSQKLAVAERSFMAPEGLNYDGNHARLFKVFEKKVISAMYAGINVQLARPLWTDNSRANPDYEAIFSESMEVMCLARINPYWYQFLTGEQIGAEEDIMSFKDTNWKVVEIDDTMYDMVKDMGPLVYMKEPSKELEMRKFQTSGSVMVTTDTYTNINTVNENGAFDAFMAFPMDSPITGIMFYEHYNVFRNTVFQGDILDIPYPTLPLTIDTELGMHSRYVAIFGARDLFLNDTYYIPMVLSNDRTNSLVYDNTTDTTSFSESNILDLEAFRV